MSLIDTRPEPERALLVQVLEGGLERERADRLLDELAHLAATAELAVVERVVAPLGRRSPATYLGKGWVETLTARVAELEVAVVLFNHPLSPVQQRNLERALKAKVVDRTGIILEIFGLRARTREGRLQVELAALLYQQSRLVRTWTHLERQKGGVGLRGGPGERQLELDRRLIRDRIHKLRQDLVQVERSRAQQRRVRREVPLLVVALVGYTNAGKSTLFNRLAMADVTAEDKLFATLDPTMRVLPLPGGSRAVLADTVGFIRELPHQLVAAFRATLEEVHQADLLLQVVDVADPEWPEQVAAVEKVLAELEATDKPMLTVYNKIDLLESPDEVLPRLLGRGQAVAVSAHTGAGQAELLQAVEQELARDWIIHRLRVPVQEGRLMARLYQDGQVLERHDGDEAVTLVVAMAPEAAGRLTEELHRYAAN